MIRTDREAVLGLLLLCWSLVLGLPVVAEPEAAELRRFLKEAVAENTVAGGSVLVLHRGEVVFGEGFGFADLASKKPFRLDTPVVVASISKPLLGTAAFRLAARGKLDLTVPISEYLPEFTDRKLESGDALKRAPTTIELFSHVSGLRGSEDPDGRVWYSSWAPGKQLGDVVKRIAAEYPFKAQPGVRYKYSGIGTEVAARVLEVVEEKPRNALFLAEVATPLGMTETFYRDAKGLKRLKGPMPTRYYRGKDDKLLVSKRRVVPPAGTYTSSGGTIITTAPDLARWLMMIRNKGRHEGEVFLESEVLAKMVTKVPRSYNARGGLFVRERNEKGEAVLLAHTGSSGTNCWIDVEKDVIGIMLTQTRGKDIKLFRAELQKRIRAWFPGLHPWRYSGHAFRGWGGRGARSCYVPITVGGRWFSDGSESTSNARQTP